MKKILLFLLVVFSFQIHAQTIGTIHSVPASPTTADDVYILVDVQFTSGGCSVWQQSHSFASAFNIDAFAMHCLGPLAFICNYTDTFHLGMLAAGNYIFSFQLENGFGGPPCTPGIVPGPTDSYNFTVSLPTAVEEIEKEGFKVYPNPASEEFIITNSELIESIEIYNTLGERIFSKQQTTNYKSQTISLDVSGFSPGIYVAEVKAADKYSRKIFSVQR